MGQFGTAVRGEISEWQATSQSQLYTKVVILLVDASTAQHSE